MHSLVYMWAHQSLGVIPCLTHNPHTRVFPHMSQLLLGEYITQPATHIHMCVFTCPATNEVHDVVYLLLIIRKKTSRRDLFWKPNIMSFYVKGIMYLARGRGIICILGWKVGICCQPTTIGYAKIHY